MKLSQMSITFFLSTTSYQYTFLLPISHTLELNKNKKSICCTVNYIGTNCVHVRFVVVVFFWF